MGHGPATNRSIRRVALAGLLALGASGCNGTGPIARWRTVRDGGIAPGLTDDERGDDGFFARLIPSTKVKAPAPYTGADPLILDPNGWKKAGDPAANPQAAAEFQAALEKFQKGEFAAAEAEFKVAARKRKDTPWGEKAQYHLAECQFQLGRYFFANDSFDKLLADYPGTDFKDKAVRREFEIANIWLDAEDPKAPREKREKLADRFTGRLPWIGVTDYALRTLERVEHHDVNGPLADDAAVRYADYQYDRGSWEDAAYRYDQLYKNHGKSPFAKRALLNSIDSKVKGYIGPAYDMTGLEEARGEVKVALEQFPDRDQKTTEGLYKTLDIVRAQEAERNYNIGAHYLWTGHVASAEYYFGEIPVKWPNSPYAAKAKVQLAKIAKMPRTQAKSSTIMSRPGSADPFNSGMTPGSMGGGGMMPGMGAMPGSN